VFARGVLARLGDRDPEANAVISAIVSEERQHHDQSEVHLEGHRRWRAVIEPVVSASTEAVI
jgi:3-demethoxyubiquinol 3-hydroxylase